MADYSQIVGLFPPEQEVATSRISQPANPDQTAAAIPVARQLNIPPILVESDPAFWNEQARVQGARQYVGSTPLLAPWLAADPNAAKLAGDDIPQLAKVAPAIPESAPASSFFDSISRGWTATEHNRAVADAALGIGEVPQPLAPAPATEPGIYPYLRDTFGGFIGSMGSTLAHAAPVAGAGAAVGAAGGPVGALVGAGTGLLYGMAADLALTAGGAAYEQSGTYRDGDGNQLPPSTRKFAAVAAGAGTAALTMLLPGVGKPALEAGKSIITDTVAKAVPYIAAEIGKAGVKGGLLNMAFTAVQSIPEELAKLSKPGFDTLVNDPQTRQDFIDRHVQSFIDGVLLFGATAVPGALIHPLGSAIAARADATRLDSLVDAAASSKLKARSPEAFGDFVRTGNKDDVGISPNADPAALGKLVPPEQVARASATGSDVHLPLSEYAAKVDPATHAALRDDIRMAPDAMTVREAAEVPPLAVRPGEAPAAAPRVPRVEFAEPAATEVRPVEPAEAQVAEAARPSAAPMVPAALPRPGENPLDAARRALYLEPLLREPLPGMSQADFARYSRLLEAQAARADEVPAPLAGAREAAEAKVDQRRDVSAFNTISASEGLKLDPAAVGDELTHGVVSTTFGTKLDPALLREGGMHPEDIAASLGYRSGSELVRDLMKVDREREIRKEMARTAAGSLLSRVLNSKQLDVLIAENRALGGPGWTREVLRGAVADQFDGSTLKQATKDAVPELMRGGRMAEQALLKGDMAGALVAKQRQAIAFERARQVKALNSEMAAYDRLSGRYARARIVASRDQEYTNHIQAILGALGRPIARGADELIRSLDGKTLEDFIREKTAAGRIMPDAGGLPRGKPFEEWTVAEFRQLANLLTSLDHNSREENLVGRVGAKVAIDSVIGQIRDNLADRQERVDLTTASRGFRHHARSLDAINIKMERLADWIDQSEPDGPLNQSVIRPIKEAQVAEDDMHAEATKALRAIDDRVVSRRLGEKVDSPLSYGGRSIPLTRGNVIAMALNMGSKSNFDKLMRGYGWDREVVRDLVNRTLTAGEWKFVQGIWGVFERFWARADDVVRRVSGVGMDRVEAVPFETPHGTFRGGYYPIEYDPLLSNFPRQDGGFAPTGASFNPLPPAGYTKTRTGVARPLRLDLDFIGNRLGEIIHNTAYREALLSAGKILGDRRVKESVARAYGPEYVKQFQPWLQHIADAARVDDRGLAWVNALSREARMNANVLAIGLNLPTSEVHGLSALSNSMREAGVGRFTKAAANLFAQTVADFFRSPENMQRQWTWANEMSGELRHRGHNMDRDMNAVLQGWELNKPLIGMASARQHFHLFAMSLISTLDKLSAVPTWIASFKKSVRDGMTEDDATAYADKVVRNAHGAGGLPDLPTVMRSEELGKWFTMFMSYFNHNYNQVRDVGRDYAAAYRDIKVGDLRAGTPHFVSAAGGTLAYLVVPALVHELIQQGLPKTQQGDNWGAWTLRALEGQVLSMFPLVRDVAQFAIHHRGRGIEVASPLNTLFNTMSNELSDIAHKTGILQGPVSPDWIRHALAAPGAFVGLSTDSIAKAGQFLWDLGRGGHYRQYAHDPVAWYRGLVYGTSHPKPTVH